MADRASLARGVDPYYHLAQAGAPGRQRQPGDYYMSAHMEGGEPAGRWWGPGAEALGLKQGQEVEAGTYESVFVERRHPQDGTLLGKLPGKRQETERLVHEMRKTMPHATAEDLHQIRITAARRAGAGPLYIDLTNSLSKSISLFHASIAENARLAEAAGEPAEAAFWSARLEAMDGMIMDAVRAGFEHFQREAGYVRTGHHGGEVRGEPTGAYEEADLAVALWFQHTSRDEDPQLHVHGQILHAARTRRDGKWRAPDSRAYGRAARGVSAIVDAHLESAMTRGFGVAWTPRADGAGREITGVSQERMDLFSSRRQSIDKRVREWAREYARANDGRKPTQRMLIARAQYEHDAGRAGKPEEKLDMRDMLKGWARKMRDAGLGELAALAREVSPLQPGYEPGPAGDGPTLAETDRAIQQALDLVQADKPTWTRADLIRCLGQAMPSSAQQLEPAAAAALPEQLADRALSERFGATLLDAPQTLDAPDELIRPDGLPKYQRHGAARYALASHLAREAALVETAQEQGAPRMERADAAARLGASVEALEAALRDRADDAGASRAECGLRMDQASALYHAVTSPERVTIITGPAGSGKTRVLAEAAKIWPGDVVGVTPSSSSRNVLAAASGVVSYNSAQFLGHLKEGRELLGIKDIRPGTLVLLDEMSMLSQPDIERLVQWADERDSKVLGSGDQEQLEAPESGGGMGLLAGHLGYAKLAVPVRFSAQWERDASLRLRSGDVSVLAEYDQQGRVAGGDPERLMDAAASQYVARYLSGADVLMMARSHEDCRELARRVRDDLVHLGLVDGGRSAAVNAGVRASAGDMLIARDNANKLRVGLADARRLSNGDGLLVERVNEDGSLECRLALDADPGTGERRFAEAAFTLPADEAAKADLAYCVTANCAQGRTVSHGLAVFRGTESRGFTYVAMSRARHSNTAFVMTTPETADPRPGGRPAPELARHDRIERERQARPALGRTPKDTTAEAVGILAGCVERRDADDAALDVQGQELADADHLMSLRVIFDNETAGARADRYAGMVRDALAAADYPVAVQAGHTARWLYKTLETAEVAGQDPRRLLHQALAGGPLTGARDVVAVIDARVKRLAGPMVPQEHPSWSDRVPQMATPAMQEYIEGVARQMDDRTARLGQHVAETAPVWALHGFGPVPEEPVERLAWERRASIVAAYREAYGYHDEAEPAGPEPATANPQQRTAWYGAMQALGPVDGADVRGMSDGALLNARAVFERETAWAPRYVADELRQVRAAAVNAELQATRANAEAKAAADEQLAAAHAELAGSYRSMETFYRGTEAELNAQMAVRREWAEATEHALRTAIAADSEYRRCHPETDLPPLASAEPEPVSQAERDELDTGQRPEWLDRLAEHRARVQAELDDRRSMRIPSEDPDADYDGFAWPELAQRQRDAVLQPPKPEIRPSQAVLEAAREREAEAEAGL